MTQFGDHLKRVRQAKNWTQEELGNKIGVHANHISRYEQNKSIPNTETLKQIAQVLEVSLDELVFGKTLSLADKIKDSELLKLFERTNHLPENDQKTLKSLIDAFIFRAETKARLAS